MIEWMQKHRKWLVITIWISAIAFIGAGMVAWGAYDYSLSGDSVAKVGKIKITKEQFARAYQNEFEQHSKESNGNFDEAQAKAMQLDQQVLNGLISNALIRNYALDLGIRVSDEEIAKAIKEFDFAKSDGVFDRKKYEQSLSAQGIKTATFEENLRDELLTRKIVNILIPQIQIANPTTNTQLESETLAAAFGISDEIDLEMIAGNTIQIALNDEKLKQFWENIKSSYMTPASYKVSAIITKSDSQAYTNEELQAYYNNNKTNFLDNNGELQAFEAVKKEIIAQVQKEKAKNQAIKEYSNLKKTTPSQAQELIITQDSTQYNQEILNALQSRNKDSVLKPMEFGDDYISIKILDKQEPQVMSFEEAKPLITQNYIKEERQKELEKLAQSKLSIFKGMRVEVKFPNRQQLLTQSYRIGNLDPYTSSILMQNIFTSPKNINYAIIGENAFLFRIVEQSIAPSTDMSFISASSSQLKIELTMQLIFDFLQQKYEVKKYI